LFERDEKRFVVML